jgi:hypothetical protein
MGVLRPGLPPDRAAVIFWSLTSHDQYWLFVVQRGWDTEVFQAWLAQTLCQQLLGAGFAIE